MAFVFVQGLLPLLGLWLMKLVVDGVATTVTTHDKQAGFGRVAILIALTGGLALVSSLCRILAGLVSEIQAQAVTDHVSDILHAKSAEADLAYYESPEYYDTLHRAQQEAPFRPPHIVRGLLQAGQSTISLVAMAGLLCSFHWAVALVLCAAAVPGVWVRLRFSNNLYHWERRADANRTPGLVLPLVAGYQRARRGVPAVRSAVASSGTDFANYDFNYAKSSCRWRPGVPSANS